MGVEVCDVGRVDGHPYVECRVWGGARSGCCG